MENAPEETQRILGRHDQQTSRATLLEIGIEVGDQRIQACVGISYILQSLGQGNMETVPLVPGEGIQKVFLG
ncbi:hypothetical protein D3C84_1277840 [compost metagenome]